MKVLRQRLGGAVRFEGVGGQAMAREGLASLFPIEELSIMGFAAVVKQLPMILRRIRETADGGDAGVARRARHHRQPRFHPSRGAARPRQRSRDPDRQLRLALGLGLAARPGARDVRLCRSRAGAAAVRARGIPQAARPALQLCRSSPDRADREPAARSPTSRSAATRRRRSCWCCREAAAARSGITWRYSARRSACCGTRAWRSN